MAVDLLTVAGFTVCFYFFEVCTACSSTSYKIVPLTSFDKYLHNETSETEVIINKCK